jgi:hypothetical protein
MSNSDGGGGRTSTNPEKTHPARAELAVLHLLVETVHLPIRKAALELRHLLEPLPHPLGRSSEDPKTSSFNGEEGNGGGGTDLNMRNSWSISESPWNSGFFLTISANMHPMLHMSTPVE